MRKLAALVVPVVLVVLLVLGVAPGTATAAVGIVDAEASLPASPVLFGERFEAELTVLVNPKLVDPEEVGVSARFDPFEPVTPVRRTIRDDGPVTHVRFGYVLQCVSLACTTGAKTERLVKVTPAVVRYRDRKGKERTLKVPWPSATPVPPSVVGPTPTTVPPATIVLVSRVHDRRFRPETATAARQQVPLDPLLQLPVSVKAPPPSYRVRPLTLGLVLFALALAALVGSVLLARPLVALLRRSQEGPPLSPLEQALVAVETAGQRQPGSAEHRESLALLARQLRRANLTELVNVARKLAWSEEPPTGSASRALTEDVRGRMEGAA